MGMISTDWPTFKWIDITLPPLTLLSYTHWGKVDASGIKEPFQVGQAWHGSYAPCQNLEVLPVAATIRSMFATCHRLACYAGQPAGELRGRKLDPAVRAAGGMGLGRPELRQQLHFHVQGPE
jgi:hypothetical protein